MHTIQLQIEDDSIANKILSILNVFKDDGVLVKEISTNNKITKEEFEDDIKQAFYELKHKEGNHTGKFVEIEI